MPRAHFVTKETLQNIRVARQHLGGKHRNAQLLELGGNLVAHTGIVMVWTGEQYDAHLIGCHKLVQHNARLIA